MSGAVQAWPFVVSRNPALDWRAIVAPPFLIDARADYLLVTETADPGSGAHGPQVRVATSGRVGSVTLLFRASPATAVLLGEETDDPLEDRFGRPVHIVEGVALLGAYDVEPAGLPTLLREVRPTTVEVYPEFWRRTDEAIAPSPSRPLLMSGVDGISGGSRIGPLLGGTMAALAAFILVLRRRARATRLDNGSEVHRWALANFSPTC